jgi:hypothetical protein
MTRTDEIEKLRQANERIVDAIKRMEHLEARLSSMAASGRQTGQAVALLATIQASLRQFLFHRDAIVGNIQRLGAAERAAAAPVAAVAVTSRNERTASRRERRVSGMFASTDAAPAKRSGGAR